MTHTPDQFIGAWSLESWRIEYDDGRVTFPFGENAVGQIMYSANGQMSATVSAADRIKRGAGNTRSWPPEQKAEAFGSYFHYAGIWRIEDDWVVHDVTLSLNPDFVGTPQRRLAEFYSQGQLRLSAKEPLKQGGLRHHILEWKK